MGLKRDAGRTSPDASPDAGDAAATREGMGQWLMRRVSRGLSEPDDDPRVMPADSGQSVDAWGLPPSPVSRQTGEDMRSGGGPNRAMHEPPGRPEMNIGERLQRLERAQDNARDAVKALHQGLSRLTEEVSQTASRFGETHTDAEEARHGLDQRLAAVEAAAHFNTNALDHALERLEALAASHASEQVQWQKRQAESDGAIGRLEETAQRLEDRAADIERTLGSLVKRPEAWDPATALEESVRAVIHRLESVEKNHAQLMNELRAGRTDGLAPDATEEADHEPALFHPRSSDAAENISAVPALPEGNPDFVPKGFGGQAREPAPGLASGSPMADAQNIAADNNFLAAARRSAQAAAEAESKSGGRLRLSLKAADDEEDRPRTRVPVLVGLILLAAGAGLVLNQKLRSPAPPAPSVRPAAHASSAPATSAPARPQPATPSPAAQVPAIPPQEQRAAMPTLDRVTQLAVAGNPLAQTIIGLKELDGDGIPPNPADAARWLERAAQAGQPVAQYRLGGIYERGQGVTANAVTAAHWYQLAAAQGNRKAMHNLAAVRASGAAGRKDMAEAGRWFAKAASLGLADSQFNLAVLYERGDGVPQSLIDAYKWYAIAADQGDAESKARLAVLGPQLSDDDRALAQKAAAGFRPAILNQPANVPPQMTDLTGN